MIASSLYEVVLAVHVMAVIAAFGVLFAWPVVYAVARRDPRGLALVHRVEYTVERWIVNPGLLLVLLAGAHLASEESLWSRFYVQWGFGVVVVAGGLVGSVTMPAAKKAEQAAARDVAAAGEGEVVLGADYRALARRLSIANAALCALVLVTILFMVVKP
jgi:Predicted integral membrane protein (DUF2269)